MKKIFRNYIDCFEWTAVNTYTGEQKQMVTGKELCNKNTK